MSIQDSQEFGRHLWLPIFFHDFLMWTIFKVLIEFVTIFFLFWFFGHKARGILVSQLGIKPAPPAWAGKVLTTGSLGKAVDYFLESHSHHHHHTKKGPVRELNHSEEHTFLVYSWYSIGIAQVNEWSTGRDPSEKKHRGGGETALDLPSSYCTLPVGITETKPSLMSSVRNCWFRKQRR